MDESWLSLVNASYVCRLGGHYRKSNVGTEQDMEVERIIDHHSYKRPYGMAHDISLLKLRSRAQINKAVNLACLPESSGEVSDGKMCWVTGNKIFQQCLTDFILVLKSLNSTFFNRIP